MPLPENLNQMLPVIMGIQLALGILLWFLGYRIFKSVLGFYGFLIGAALGGGLAAVLGAGQLIAIIAAVVVGLICAVLAVSLYFVGVFLAGAALGVFAGVSLSSALKGVPLLTLILGVAFHRVNRFGGDRHRRGLLPHLGSRTAMVQRSVRRPERARPCRRPMATGGDRGRTHPVYHHRKEAP